MDVDIHGKHTLYIQEYKGTIKIKMAVITLFQIFSQFKDKFTLRKILLLLILDFFPHTQVLCAMVFTCVWVDT